MAPTPDFDLPSGHCSKLEKSLYGLRSSLRSWWKHLDRFIKSLHFTPSMYYIYDKGVRVYLAIYVDDIINASANLIHE